MMKVTETAKTDEPQDLKTATWQNVPLSAGLEHIFIFARQLKDNARRRWRLQNDAPNECGEGMTNAKGLLSLPRAQTKEGLPGCLCKYPASRLQYRPKLTRRLTKHLG